MPRKTQPKATTKPSPELPNWLTETMAEMKYSLEVMCGCGDCALDIVEVTRDEFLKLKRHLAKMRGYRVAPE